MVKITEVTGGSRADRHGVRAGDFLCTVNGREITDVLDYRFFLADTEVRLGLMRDGSPLEIVIHKREYDDIGLDFETPLMDRKHSCENKCIFCFIDQLPAGMRETLYFKDDDSRLSFLHGNFVTLTNLHDADIQRIMEMHISPINVSVHTTNPELRVKMMHNKRAGLVLEYLPRLAAAGITLCGQIVLCRGINDGAELDRSMRDLFALGDALESVSIVPAGAVHGSRSRAHHRPGRRLRRRMPRGVRFAEVLLCGRAVPHRGAPPSGRGVLRGVCPA